MSVKARGNEDKENRIEDKLEIVIKKLMTLEEIRGELEDLKERMSNMEEELNNLQDNLRNSKVETPELTPRQRMVYEDLKRNKIKQFTVYDIARRYNISYVGSWKLINSLVEKGKVKKRNGKVGDGNKTSYELNMQE